MAARKTKPLAVRWLEKVDKNGPVHPVLGTPCWLWTGSISTTGYARLAVAGHNRYAHVVAYELLIGAVPSCDDLDHLCRNRACVNPGHLEPVPHIENVLRGVGPTARNARKTCCIHGHPLSGGNLKIPHDTQVRRGAGRSGGSRSVSGLSAKRRSPQTAPRPLRNDLSAA